LKETSCAGLPNKHSMVSIVPAVPDVPVVRTTMYV
jgi:hypothetical protein